MSRVLNVRFFELNEVPDKDLAYAVILTLYQGQWAWVRHHDRHTWEIPGGRREPGEDIAATAARELREETGAQDFSLTPIGNYGVFREEKASYGQIFVAEVESFGELPESEIGEVRFFASPPAEQTYPQIQPLLLNRVTALLRNKNT